LNYILSRATVRHSQRDRHSKRVIWRVKKLCDIQGKEEGVPLKIVESKNTSRQCPECEYIDQRNRKSRNEFECLQCGFKEMSDYVGALNIKNRVPVNEPMVAPLFSAVTSRHALAGGGS
jgi:transposase